MEDFRDLRCSLDEIVAGIVRIGVWVKSAIKAENH
jgi:hypothetical protein